MTRQASTSAWQLDPERSTIAFHARSLWGLVPVRGSFSRFRGTLRCGTNATAELVVEAASLRTGIRRRDEHLRSPDFFDAARHPEIRFFAHGVRMSGDQLNLRGELSAAGRSVVMDAAAALRQNGDGLELHAEVPVDQRELGMSKGVLAMIPTPSRIVINAILIPVPSS